MLNKDKTYLVLNYCSSPVVVETRYGGYLVPGGTEENPASLPFSLDEIVQINSNSPVFTTGTLLFEPEYEEDIYQELRIRDWKSIMREADIRDAILNPTVEKLTKILAIESDFYFERIYGVFVGLKNANYAISGNVENIMYMRRKEFRMNKRKTAIELEAKNLETPVNTEIEDLKTQIAMLTKMLSGNKETATGESVPEAEEKPVKKTTKKTSTKKTTV